VESLLVNALLSLALSTLRQKTKVRQIIPCKIEYREDMPLDLTGDLTVVPKIQKC